MDSRGFVRVPSAVGVMKRRKARQTTYMHPTIHRISSQGNAFSKQFI